MSEGALAAWVGAVVDTPTASLKELADGIILTTILQNIDGTHFNLGASSNQKALQENWVLRFNNLKRLYKLVIRYFEDVLNSSTAALPTPNLQLIAKGDEVEACKLVGLVLALAVQSEKRAVYVEKIQKLEEWVQRDLMLSIEQVASKIPLKPSGDKTREIDADTEFYDLQTEKSHLLTQKDSLQMLYSDLLSSYNTLKFDHEEALASLSSTEKQVLDLQSAQPTQKAKTQEVVSKAEVDRLRSEVQKAEDALLISEHQLAAESKHSSELSRKVEDLTPLAAESTRLKDQCDELEHLLDKAKKSENVLEKMKKKVEEGNELRRAFKDLEEQNIDLVERYATLEDQYSTLKTLSTRPQASSQIAALQTTSSSLQRQIDDLTSSLTKSREGLRVEQEARLRSEEALSSSEDRVRELESQAQTPRDEGGIGEEVVSGSANVTELKLQIRKLKKELQKSQGADVRELLKEKKEKLLLEDRMEEIRSGKSSFGNGKETAIALRQRMQDLEEEVDALKSEHAELQSKTAELAALQSDLNLVGKHKVEIVRSLRREATAELEEVKKKLKDEDARGKALLLQVNTLLLDKTILQEDGLGTRDQLIEKERRLGSLQTTGATSETELARLREENEKTQREVKDMQEKLQKARTFIKQQDKLFKEAQSAGQLASFEDAEQGYKCQISTLTEDLERAKTNNADLEARYRREQQLMLSAWHDLGMRVMREGLTPGPAKSSWLSQQRARTGGGSLRH